MGQIFQRMTGWILGYQNNGNITYLLRQSRPSSGITEADVLRASNIIAEARDRNSGVTEIAYSAALYFGRFECVRAGSKISAGSQQKGSRKHVGSHYNEWRDPIIAYGKNHPQWLEKADPYIRDMDFQQKDWDTAKTLIDTTLELLLKEMQSEATKYKGLQVMHYVHQGSSREGLKVIAPDEFDTLLLYCIDGLNFTKESISETPEYCSLVCTNKYANLMNNFPQLFEKGVFKHVDSSGKMCLNSRALHQHVFQAIIDHSVHKTVRILNQLDRRGENTSFLIYRIMNPPSINLQLKLFYNCEEIESTIFDVDIVPGMLLRQDMVADPAQPNKTMDCPVYAVFRWTEESDRKAAKFGDTEVVWRVCTSGYEKHTFDLAQCYMQQRYIITSLRILKTYFQKSKQNGRNQLVSVLRSYHLKHIAFYVLLFTQYLKPGVVLIGVSEATQFFLGFLRVSLERNRLPHFFHSNRYVTCMFPNYPVNHTALRFNLLERKKEEALRQALSFENHLVPLLGNEKAEIDPVMEHIVYQYDQFISEGEYS